MLRKTKLALILASALAVAGCDEDDSNNSNSSNVQTPEIRFTDVSLEEGSHGQTKRAEITARLNRSATSDTTITYRTVDGSAIAGVDYESAEGQLVIPRGSTTGSIFIDVIGNDYYGPDRSFTVEYSVSRGVDLENNSSVVTILNDDPAPTVSFSQEFRAVQETVGTVYLDVRTSHPSVYNGRVDLEFDGIANRGSRYDVDQTRVEFEPHETHKRVPITIIDDNIPRGGENIQVTLTSPRHVEIGDIEETTILIRGNTRLPDTGVLHYYNHSDRSFSASAPDIEHLYQDADFGLDNKVGASVMHDGYASLSYTKLDRHGNRLPADSQNYYCVQDNHTGVVYEARKGGHGYRNFYNTYYWVETDESKNGGFTAVPNPQELEEIEGQLVGASCSFPLPVGNVGVSRNGGCSTENYLRYVNSRSYCGFSDWRLPTIQELQNIVIYDEDAPTHDAVFFADAGWFSAAQAINVRYLSSTPVADNSSSVWCLDQSTGRRMLCVKQEKFHVRAVRTPTQGGSN